MKMFLDPIMYDEWEKAFGTPFMKAYFIRFSLVVGCR
jgi:hypothetical protein